MLTSFFASLDITIFDRRKNLLYLLLLIEFSRIRGCVNLSVLVFLRCTLIKGETRYLQDSSRSHCISIVCSAGKYLRAGRVLSYNCSGGS